ncbi:hypothetical protein GGG16DRAFT_119386 [Schizophyllum commune]
MGGVAVTVRSMLALPDDDLPVSRTSSLSAPRPATDIFFHAVSLLRSLSSTSSGRRTISAGNIERECLPIDSFSPPPSTAPMGNADAAFLASPSTYYPSLLRGPRWGSSLFAHPSDYDADADLDFGMGTGTGFDCDQEYERRPCSRMPSTGTHHSYGGFDGTGRDGWDVRSGAFCAVSSPSRCGWRLLRIFSAAAMARRYLD